LTLIHFLLPSILLYHIYPINHWQEITGILFQKLPFTKIAVHVSLPSGGEGLKQEIDHYFTKYEVDEILYSANSGTGEVDALLSFVHKVDFSGLDILTYMHCKGVTKPENKHIAEWTKLMRYFLIEKMDTCKRAFRKGYITYGINKSIPNQADEGFKGCNFFYEGNFVSLNLKKVDLKKAVNEHLEHTYYGLEGFWGKLCPYELGYSAFDSGINHYLMAVKEKDYTSLIGRVKYKMIRDFYKLGAKFKSKQPGNG
jgi:hypothetical protein